MTHSLSIIAPRGNTIGVTVSGSGPPIMLLHGFPLDHRMWLPQVVTLSERFQVIAPDLRGFGQSSIEGEDYSLADIADDVEYLRQHLAEDKAICLCGLSMGGYVAFEYWRRYSQHVAGLVLSNTKPQSDTDEARESRLAMAEAALKQGVWPAVQGMLPKLLSDLSREQKPDVCGTLEQIMRDARPQAIAQAQRAMAERGDFIDKLETIQAPTLVVTGEHDPLSPPEATRQWAEKIPGARVVVIPEAAHVPPLETPEPFNGVLEAFLNECFVG